MKKLFFALMGAALIAGNAMAQDYAKNIYGVRAGVNLNTMSGDVSAATQGTTSFHVGGTYQRLLLSNRPLYLETGLFFTQRGCEVPKHDGSIKIRESQLQIPVMVNYQVRMGKNFKFIPAVGVYYGFGIGGKFKGINGYDFSVNTYGSDGILKRSDLGIRTAVGFAWKKYSLIFGYEWGLTNIAKASIQEIFIREVTFKNQTFTLSLGYNF